MTKEGPSGSTRVARPAADRRGAPPTSSSEPASAPEIREIASSPRLEAHRQQLPGLDGPWRAWLQLVTSEGGAAEGPLQRARRLVETVLADSLDGVPPAQRAASMQVALQSLVGLRRLAGHPLLAASLVTLARRVEGQRLRQGAGRLLAPPEAPEVYWSDAEGWVLGLLSRLEGREGVATTSTLALHLIEVLARAEAPLTLARERQIAQAVVDHLVGTSPGNGLDLAGAAWSAAAIDAALTQGRTAEARLAAARPRARAAFARAEAELSEQLAAEVSLGPAARPHFDALQRTLRVMAQAPGPSRIAAIFHWRGEGLAFLERQQPRLPNLQDNLQLIGGWLEALAPTPLAELALGFIARLLAAARGTSQDNLHLDLRPGQGAGAQAAGVIRALLRLNGGPLAPEAVEALSALEVRSELGLLQFALSLGPADLEVGADHGVGLVQALSVRPVWPNAADSPAAITAWLQRRRVHWEALREGSAPPARAGALAGLAASTLPEEAAAGLAELQREISAAFPKVSLFGLWPDAPPDPGLGQILGRVGPERLLEAWPERVSRWRAAQLHHQDPSAQRRALRLGLAEVARGAPGGGITTRDPRSRVSSPSGADPAATVRDPLSELVAPLVLEAVTPSGRLELLRCGEAIRAFLDHLEGPAGAAGSGQNSTDDDSPQAALYSVLRATAAGTWPAHRYQGPEAARRLRALDPDQQRLWCRTLTLPLSGAYRPSRELFLGAEHLLREVRRNLPGPASPRVPAPDEERPAQKGTAEHRRHPLAVRGERDRQVLNELLVALNAPLPFSPGLRFTLEGAGPALGRLGRADLAEVAAGLARAVAAAPTLDVAGLYVSDDDRLSEFWSELPVGPLHPSGFRRWVTLHRAAQAHQKVVRVHEGGRRVALAPLVVASGRGPGGRGAVLWLGPLDGEGGGQPVHRALVEALAIHKATLLEVPLLSSSSTLPQAAARAGLKCQRETWSLVNDEGLTPGLFEEGAGAEVQVDLQVIRPPLHPLG